MSLDPDTRQWLKKTSRTFYLPIIRLPSPLLETVAGAYLCMRAIDEIEDHAQMSRARKTTLLQSIALDLQKNPCDNPTERFQLSLADEADLPEVSQRLSQWLSLPSSAIAPRVWDATAAMADRMAYWAAHQWQIDSRQDLDAYTYSVAGAVGLLLSDLWAWYDGTVSDRRLAVGFGRGLQAVNILRNDKEDLKRGISYYPQGWTRTEMFAYARHNLARGEQYLQALNDGPAADFCRLPLTLAKATLGVMQAGREKLSREEVEALLESDENKN